MNDLYILFALLFALSPALTLMLMSLTAVAGVYLLVLAGESVLKLVRK